MAYIPNPDTQPGKKGGKNVTAIENQQTYSRDLQKVTGRVDAYGFESSQDIAFGEKSTGVLGSEKAAALELARLPGRSGAEDIRESAPSGTVTEIPQFSLAAGSYTGTQVVSIYTATDGATIMYTLDGTTPTRSHGVDYTAPVFVTTLGSNTLKAMAFKNNSADSPVFTAVYVIS